MSGNRVWSMVIVLFVVGIITFVAVGVGSAERTSGESHFEVEITETNAPLTEGETFIVNATITNTGTATDSQQIHLKSPDDEIVDSVAGPPMTLAPGESENVTLQWETGLGDEGSGEFSVQSNDEYPHQSIEIEKGAFFSVAINDTDLPISQGDRLNVTANVTTPRGTIETTRVQLKLDGSIIDDKRAVLLYGNMDQVRFSINSSDLTPGESTLTVATEGDRDSIQITVDEDTVSITAGSTSSETEAEGSTNPSTSDSVTPTTMSDSSSDGGPSGSESSDGTESDPSHENSASMTASERPSDDGAGGFNLGQLVTIVMLISVGAGVVYSIRTN